MSRTSFFVEPGQVRDHQFIFLICLLFDVGDVRGVQIGTTRCDDKCENTVLLETQGPCGRRKCRDNTVTHDTT